MKEYSDLAVAAELLSDPATSASDLALIAQHQPSLHAGVALHPAAYDDLLIWLDEQGNPDLSRIVEQRRIADAAVPTPRQELSQADFEEPATQVISTIPVAATPTIAQVGLAKPVKQHSGKSWLAGVAVGAVIAAVGYAGWATNGFGLLADDGEAQTVALELSGSDNALPTTGEESDATAEPPIVVANETIVTGEPPVETVTIAPPVVTETVTESIDTEAQARQSLLEISGNHDGLADNYFVALSTKQSGTVWEGKTWTYSDIWNEFQQLQNTHGDVTVVDPTPYTNLSGEWFMSILRTNFTNRETAQVWCDARHLGEDYCQPVHFEFH